MIRDFKRNNEPSLSASGDSLQFEILKNIDSVPDSETGKLLSSGSSSLSLGLLPMRYEVKKSTVQYNYFIPPHVKLTEYFAETTVDFECAHKIFKNIADIPVTLKRKSKNILNPKNCILNSNYMYINRNSKAVAYLYIPFRHQFEEINFGEFIHNALSLISFEDDRFLSRTLAIMEKKQFTAEEFSMFLDGRELKSAYLTNRSGTKTYPVNSTPFTMGRREDQSLPLTDVPGISREHTRITTVNNEYLIEDLSSSGTLLDGVRLTAGTKYKLNDNAEIALRCFDKESNAYNKLVFIFRLK